MLASRSGQKRSARENVPLSPEVRDFHPREYRKLLDRLGAERFRRRMLIQKDRWADTVHQDRGLMWIERMIPVDRLIISLLKTLRLYERGNRSFRDIRLTENTGQLPCLPCRFDRFHILHLSTLHHDLDASITPAINNMVADLAYDVVVLTSDFNNSTTDIDDVSMAETRKLVQAMRGPPSTEYLETTMS